MEPKDFWLKKIKNIKKTKNFEDAIKFKEKIKDIDDTKNKPDFWYKNGLAYFEIKEYEKAMSCFDKDLKQNKPTFETLYQKGIVFYVLKNYPEANECFNKAFEIKYSTYLKTQDQVQTLKKHKEFVKIVKYSTELSKFEPIPYQFWHYKALVLAKLGKYQESTECYDTCLQELQKIHNFDLNF